MHVREAAQEILVRGLSMYEQPKKKWTNVNSLNLVGAYLHNFNIQNIDIESLNCSGARFGGDFYFTASNVELFAYFNGADLRITCLSIESTPKDKSLQRLHWPSSCYYSHRTEKRAP
jgi:hypothetical protein